MAERNDELLTSTLTVGEVLVRPIEAGDTGLVNRYEEFLDSPGVQVIPFDRACARIYGSLRRDRTIKAPDAMQLACAASAGTNLFITNDSRLSRKTIPQVDFIVPLQQAWF